MPISALLIEKCLRPQFVWDNKSAGKWLLCNTDRSEFFKKDLGILVFLNLGNLYKCPEIQIQSLIWANNTNFDFYKTQLQLIQSYSGDTAFNIWLKRETHVKTQLAVNIMYFNYGIKI